MKIITSLTSIAQPLRGVVFDMDGVTFDTMDHAYNWQKSIYDKMGDKTKFFGPYTDEWMDNYNDIYMKHGIRGLYDFVSHVDWDKNEKEIWRLYNEYSTEHAVSTIKKDGVDVADVIREVYERGRVSEHRMTRLRLGVNTTKGFSSLKPLLEKSEIYGCFDTIVTYDDVLRCLLDGKAKLANVSTDNIDELRELIPANMKDYIEKPNGLSSMLAVNSMGVSPHEVIVFEDTVNGILAYKPIITAPRSVPAYVVGVTWGFVKDEQKLINAGADMIMDSPKDIVPLIEMLGGFS